MIPEFIDIGGPWGVLPPGIHDATLKEVERRFATNTRRKSLLEGFLRGVDSLRQAGCRVVFLDGSSVAEKPNPGDFDSCWDSIDVNVVTLDPVLLDFSQGRKNQKEQYGGEFFPSSARADGSRTFVDFFQTDRHTGERKGIVCVALRGDAEEQHSDDN